jgi:hypothetical protein
VSFLSDPTLRRAHRTTATSTGSPYTTTTEPNLPHAPRCTPDHTTPACRSTSSGAVLACRNPVYTKPACSRDTKPYLSRPVPSSYAPPGFLPTRFQRLQPPWISLKASSRFLRIGARSWAGLSGKYVTRTPPKASVLRRLTVCLSPATSSSASPMLIARTPRTRVSPRS